MKFLSKVESRKSKVKQHPMKINGQSYHTIWQKEGEPTTIQIIDQRYLPHRLVFEDLKSSDDFAIAIKEMHVRGAPLIGVTAAFGIYKGLMELSPSNWRTELPNLVEKLKATRPTAVNLAYAVDRIVTTLEGIENLAEAIVITLEEAKAIKQDSIDECRKIGEFGLPIIEKLSQAKQGKTVNILTHCNAGWIACIDYGTATAPIYQAFDKGIDVHVWVDETRPRNQGARITAFELQQHGVPHTVITDNAGGHLMQHGQVDMVIVGTDRTTKTGDVANKIGTYLKALAAHDNQVPFYVALPSSTIDWMLRDGVKEIPIETRSAEEVQYIQGLHDNEVKKVLLTPAESPAANYAFDVTPARLVTGLITERGVCKASEEGIMSLFPEQSILNL